MTSANDAKQKLPFYQKEKEKNHIEWILLPLNIQLYKTKIGKKNVERYANSKKIPF